MLSPKKCLSIFFILLLLQSCLSTSIITSDEPLNDGDVLVSATENFVLGFFSPSNSTSRRYVGIWYNKISVRTVVWVANRDNPVSSTSGVLSLDNTGNLVLVDSRKPDVVIWSTHVSNSSSIVLSNFTAELLDSGNFVVYEDDSKNGFVWQSFDFPTDTQLPEMIIGVNRRSGQKRFLTSWKSPDDPGTGSYSLMIDVNGSRPQLFLYRDGIPFWRAGHWNGVRYSGIPEMNTSNSIFKVKYVDNPEEVSLWFSLRNTSIFLRQVLIESPRAIERQTWQEDVHKWGVFYTAPKDECDSYSHCGAFGDCNSLSAGAYECKCLPGFEPKSLREWNLRDGSQGCVPKRKGRMCRDGEGFVKLAEVKLPDTTKTRLDMNLDDKACADLCLKNCSCTGYASANTSGGSFSGCITWYNELIDLREYPSGGQDFYLRVDAVELENWKAGASAPKTIPDKDSKKSKNIKVLVLVPLNVAFAVLLTVTYWFLMKKKTGKAPRKQENISSFSSNINDHGISVHGSTTGEEGNDIGTSTIDVKIYSLSTIVAATENFSLAHKVGEGGFGSVYKGKLHNGQDIAVKRLSSTSGQGMKEFRNEVTLIAKLQHRNLVRLFGYCTQNEEKMLIYEYLPNKGLDCFLFDREKNGMLDWEKRFDIILGIARGMVYLHHDSRLRIIHRDLKASNILLDAHLNPKISDFGMARISGSDQIEEQTKRVVGTYGYMSPEYAMQGHFSIKSDVFSFGVLLLEIITGRKNSSYCTEDSVNLIGHVWELWRESNVLEVVDQSLGESRHHDPRILRCIHIGLLCVQESAAARPSMSEVVFMLSNETSLPQPGQAAFIFRTSDRGPTSTSSTSVGGNPTNELTISRIEGR
ncbi:Receptor-like serine/threonine-protein kinase [Heracleum sosnowskyi]|uniref:Receptor-like serine/threonine-protein kinase n=1 Tax=Heracleum sosnowskyi TaxID=360622 RepID=A0AAD8HEW6_9APIA|nr:Receptor-like serine/threonine-protein kinase [Heracleum sosnowskyi]